MRNAGNPSQWPENYPSLEVLQRDIKLQQSYLVERNNKIVATFVLAKGIDPTYLHIEQGNWLNNDPKIMIYDEPTRGIDVNAKQQIFEIMWNQAKQGNSSIFVSTELEELPGVCNRILVLRGGRITEELTTEKIDSMTTNDLYTLCMGGHSSEREN